MSNFKSKMLRSKTLNSTVQLVKQPGDDDDRYILKTTSMKCMKSMIKFKLGDEFEETNFRGSKVKSSITFENDIMIHNQKNVKEDKTMLIERRFFPDEMITIYRIGDVSCTIWFSFIE